MGSNSTALSVEAQLIDDIALFYDDPLGFVMYAYPWGETPELSVVKLPAPYSFIYDSEYGPDLWACELLTAIGEQVKAHNFDGTHAVDAIREAVSSGHGVGKSAFTAWLVDWIMSTRPHCKGVVTANTSPQLESKTWAEIAKWTKRCITGHWFNVSTGKNSMRMSHKQFPESWRCDAQTCREENSEAFAGLHAASSTAFYIFDEASAIPNAISDVAEGGMTDGEPMWFKFGNPTRNTGNFYDCFNAMRHRWNNRHIDSRTVQITNKKLLQEFVDDYGEDSDFVRVRVRGVFPRASSMQFIGRDLVDDAMARDMPFFKTVGGVAAVGVDVARFGDDQSVIRTRVGRDARSIPPKKYRSLDTMQLSAKVAEHVNYLKQQLGLRVVLFVDGGGVGGGVVDRLRQLGYDVVEVQFGGAADEPLKYINKRTEMYARLKAALPSIYLDRDEELATDLTGAEYMLNDKDQVVLERKRDMKKRGMASPDNGDALALTYAFPLHSASGTGQTTLPGETRASNSYRRREHDPYA